MSNIIYGMGLMGADWHSMGEEYTAAATSAAINCFGKGILRGECGCLCIWLCFLLYVSVCVCIFCRFIRLYKSITICMYVFLYVTLCAAINCYGHGVVRVECECLCAWLWFLLHVSVCVCKCMNVHVYMSVYMRVE